jgi:hypothetical protein
VAQYNRQFNLDTFPALGRLAASSRERISEGVKVVVKSHTFSLKFLCENGFAAGEVETFE